MVKLYTDGSEEAERIGELLKRAKVPFETIRIEGKVLPELLVGDPACPKNWLTGEEAAKKWIEKIKKEKRQG
ncbi:MAG: hypothetical protein Q7S03_00135 [bacterium]|nr:hypothetical protein [bacterium]